MLKICILGYGGIARAHQNGYKTELEEKGIAKLVAACDICEEQFTKDMAINIDSGESEKSELRGYTDLDEMLEKEKPDIVTVALPTYLHKEKTVYLLNKGYNVMCEKPMALTYEDCLEMIEASKKSGAKLMIGQCIHFASAYEYLKEVIETEKYGKIHSAFMHRLSTPPNWGWDNWFMDAKRSGGCLFDLHVHDIDFARYAFGEPKEVSCRTRAGFSEYEYAFSTLMYDDFTVSVIGDWSLQKFPFESYFRVNFDNAVLECKANKLTVYPASADSFDVELDGKSPYGDELAYFCHVVTEGIENVKNSPESSALSIKLAQTLKKSADMKGAIIPFEV